MALPAAEELSFNIEHLPQRVIDGLWVLAGSDSVAWCLIAGLMSAGVDEPRAVGETRELLALLVGEGVDALPPPVRSDRRVAEVTGWVDWARLRAAAVAAEHSLAAVS